MTERHRGARRNGRRPVLVVSEAPRARPRMLPGAMRRTHQIDAELVRDVADVQE